jgi:FixJ family two-component response regulator
MPLIRLPDSLPAPALRALAAELEFTAQEAARAAREAERQAAERQHQAARLSAAIRARRSAAAAQQARIAAAIIGAAQLRQVAQSLGVSLRTVERARARLLDQIRP